MTFCFHIQNFAEIGQSVDELWPKKRFSRWRSPPSWIPKISIFGHVTVTGFNIWCTVPNFIKIGRFLQRYGDITIFWQPSAILDFKNMQVLSCGLCRHTVLLSHTKFRRNWTISRWVMAKKAIFKMAAVRHLGFVMTSQYCIAGHIFIVQILSWNFLSIGVVVSEMLAIS